jgi:hypothetical protein
MGPGCDIYSLGVILYQLLTGRLPFEGSVAEVLGQIVTRPPEPPSKHRPDLDPRLEAICLKALHKHVADRYASMRDFAAALADYLRGDSRPAGVQFAPGSAVPTPAVSRGARGPIAWFRRKPLRLVLAVVGAAAIVLLAGVVLWISTSTGTIQIQLDDPRAHVDVQVDGESIDSAGLDEPLRLRPGKHHLLVTGRKIQTVSESFTVARGDNPVLRVKLVSTADDRRSKSHGRRHEDDDDGKDDD